MQSWQPAYVGVGSNLSEPARQVRAACVKLGELPRTRRILTSPLYASRPFGRLDQPDFVNAVVGVLTELSAFELLEQLRTLEGAMGRAPVHERWGPRIIDLDLLAYAHEQRSDAVLTLPHPGIVERNFVLYPLADIAAELELPRLGRVSDLKGRLSAAGLTPL